MNYIRLWRNTPRYAGFLFGSFPVALISLAVVISIFSLGLGLALFGVGLVIWRFGLVLARERGSAWRDWIVRADGRTGARWSLPACLPRPTLAKHPTPG